MRPTRGHPRPGTSVANTASWPQDPHTFPARPAAAHTNPERTGAPCRGCTPGTSNPECSHEPAPHTELQSTGPALGRSRPSPRTPPPLRPRPATPLPSSTGHATATPPAARRCAPPTSAPAPPQEPATRPRGRTTSVRARRRTIRVPCPARPPSCPPRPRSHPADRGMPWCRYRPLGSRRPRKKEPEL